MKTIFKNLLFIITALTISIPVLSINSNNVVGLYTRQQQTPTIFNTRWNPFGNNRPQQRIIQPRTQGILFNWGTAVLATSITTGVLGFYYAPTILSMRIGAGLCHVTPNDERNIIREYSKAEDKKTYNFTSQRVGSSIINKYALTGKELKASIQPANLKNSPDIVQSIGTGTILSAIGSFCLLPFINNNKNIPSMALVSGVIGLGGFILCKQESSHNFTDNIRNL